MAICVAFSEVFAVAGIFDLFKQIESKETHAPISKIVACLGNPGEEYVHTRHNCGFLCADYIVQKYNASPWKIKFKGLCAECTIGGVRTLILKPQTYMNNSGESVREALGFYKLGTDALTVICDDINFECGRMRIRKNGSDGGQRGLRSIITCLGSDDFARIRIGAGKKPEKYDMAAWVLSKFTADEQKELFECLGCAAEALPLILEGKTELAMSKFNGTGKTGN